MFDSRGHLILELFTKDATEMLSLELSENEPRCKIVLF